MYPAYTRTPTVRIRAPRGYGFAARSRISISTASRMNSTATYNEWRPDPFTLERVEVLRGPSSMIYGDTSEAGF